jgi:SAM-dependent methyltransferase
VNGRQALGIARGLARGGLARQNAVARLVPSGIFQPYGDTSFDRYPDEFRAVAALAEPRRVLSFGCSSGAELATVRRYFPDAEVRGIDANPLAVRRARRLLRDDPHVEVVRASDAAAEPASSYDVVLAMAVFRHGALNAAPPRCDHVLRFADFERTVTGLARCVRPGGVLVIRHANFRFGDTAAAGDFEPVATGFGSSADLGVTPVYGPDDELLPGAERDDGIHRRRSQSGSWQVG